MILRQAGYSYEQTRNIRIVESDVDNLSKVIQKTNENNEIITFKNQQGIIRTAVEVSQTEYKLIKHVWISPESKVFEIRTVINSLPEGEATRAERNRVTDVLAKRFRVTKRGG